MAKIQGPLFSDGASGPFGKVLDFTADGNVRHEAHLAPPISPGVALSRVIVKAINGVLKKISTPRRADLQLLFPDPQNWASAVTSHTIGHNRTNWEVDQQAYGGRGRPPLPGWTEAAEVLPLRDASITDTNHITYTITKGDALFHVCTGVWRCSVPHQPAQPDGTNAPAWLAWLFGYVPPIPDNAITLNGELLTLAGEILTL
jgi:hypothetical protein